MISMWRLIFCVLIACLPACTKDNSEQSASLPDITKWAQPDVDMVALLTSEPASCLKMPEQSNARPQVLLGRAAFRSPYLLGGQAARRGFSCNACHTNGDVNEYFFVTGMSSEPGTVDVTNFHFSKTLGDGTFNPKPIPSLVKLSVPETTEQVMAREAFVLRLIEKEFDGAAPSATIKSGLLAYVAVLDERACNGDVIAGREMLTHRLDLVDELIELLDSDNDTNTIEFLRASMRAELGRLHSRYPRSENMRENLTALSKLVKLGESGDIETVLTRWLVIRKKALASYQQSLFSPDFVRYYLHMEK